MRHIRIARRSWIGKLALAIAVSLFVLMITQEHILKLGIVRRMELASIDYRFEYLGTNPTITDSCHVVIVEITEETFRSLPERWPFPRSYYAHLIRNLHRAGAKAIGLDLIFSTKDSRSPEDDDELRAAIKETGVVVLAGKSDPLKDNYHLRSTAEDYGNVFFPVDSCIGLVNIRNDADGVLRRYSPFFDTNSERLVPSFAFAVLNKYFRLPTFSIPEESKEDYFYAERAFPKYDANSFLIHFFGPSRTFPHVQFTDVIDDSTITTKEEKDLGKEINTFTDPEFGYLYDGTFKDKIVIVGSTVPEEHDLFPVAISRGVEEGDNQMYGVEIHANVVESIARSQPLHSESKPKEIISIFIFTILTFFLTSSLKESKTRHHFLVELNGFLFSLAQVFVLGYAALILIKYYDYLVTVISPILGVISGYFASTAYHFVVERKQRVLIKAMFSNYVNPTFVDELVTNPERLTLGGRRMELSVLFSDIEGFTTISEGMTPEQLVGLLNEYLSAMSGVVFKNNGTLDKFEGDAVMAFWGAPIAQEDHAYRACISALQMQDTATEIRNQWAIQNKPPLRIRVGINTGEMVVGNMGGMGKFDYTVIGDSVNLASRLEGANKLYKTGIMVSQRTYDLVRTRILGRELDLISVKGRSEPLRVYELLQLRDGSLDPSLREFLETYDAGLRVYRERNWKAAREYFRAAQHLRPDDHPSMLYHERSRLFEKNPPPDDWDGVFVMASK